MTSLRLFRVEQLKMDAIYQEEAISVKAQDVVVFVNIGMLV